MYYYVEGKRIDEVTYLCKSLKLHILTNKKEIHENAVNQGLSSTLISNEPRRFKKEIRNISPSVVFIDNDSTSPRGQWIAKYFISYLISELTINSRARYIARKNAGFIGNVFAKFMHRLAGVTGLLYGADIDIHDFSIKTYLRLIRDIFFFGYKPHTALPGWYCNKIIVQNDEIQNLYLENDFSEDRVINIGNPYEDYYLELCKNSNNTKTDIDVLLFSQPFYLRGFDDWISEVGDLVDECHANGLKLVIKLHPRDEINKYRVFDKKCTLDYSDGSSPGIVNLIKRSKLIVMKHSTVMIQSLLSKKPIAFINYRNVLPFLDGTIDFMDIMVLSRKGSVKAIFDATSEELEAVLESQDIKLRGIARFDTESTSRLKTILSDDGFFHK
jgi:hypothetical protein